MLREQRHGEAGLRSALWAGIVSCGVPLAIGAATGWSLLKIASYGVLALLFICLTQCQSWPPAWREPIRAPLWRYLLLMGTLGFGLQLLSADPFIQPIVFTIPLVDAALRYDGRRTALVGGCYLVLMVTGLWLGGESSPEAFLYAPAAYGALMGFMYAFTNMAVEQRSAREQADRLAGALARERDYLRQLIDVTASLTRDLDRQQVLEQVAVAGRALAQAERARVWLRPEPGDAGDAMLRLVAAAPAEDVEPSPVNVVDEVVQSGLAKQAGEMLAIPLVAKGSSVGVLELLQGSCPPTGLEGLARLQPFATIAAAALENARLLEQVQVSATLAERNRLAGELHDTIAQKLTAVTMQLEAAQRGFDRAPDRARGRVGRAYELARETLEDVRKSVWTLASPLVDGQALPAALQLQAQRFAIRTGIETTYDHHGADPWLDHGTATQALRIVQEALQNVEKHAQASQVMVRSEMGDGGLEITVVDNGTGFDPSMLSHVPGDGSGFGLVSLGERARLTGGTLEIKSAPGFGTRVTLLIPMTRSADGDTHIDR